MFRLLPYALAALVAMIGSAHAQIDPVPVIVTYELKKQGRAARAAARNPKAFWIRQIMARIESEKPRLATPLQQATVVDVTFVVGRNGRIVSKAVAKSSGVAMADRSAMAMLERAQPFPPMPDGLTDREMTFDVPVRFR